MHDSEPGSGFLRFSDLLTGYRISAVLMTAHRSGLFACVAERPASSAELCARLGWDSAYGQRFLDCLCALGLLDKEGNRYDFSRCAQPYLHSSSPCRQRQTLDFEQQLLDSWSQLEATLQGGRRIFAADGLPPEALHRARQRYLGAMDEAAGVRAGELWQCCPNLATSGVMLDIGAGSGAYLREFLQRNPGWSAHFCDLPDIVAAEDLHPQLHPLRARISWCGCNLLDDGPSDFDRIAEQSCDIVLLSNVLHCQSAEESLLALRKAAAKTSTNGILLVHDFFADADWRGALYDLHMMLNTYNGAAPRQSEIVAAACRCGLPHHSTRHLPSGSTLLAFARAEEALQAVNPQISRNGR